MAFKALQAREITSAIVGGSNLIMSPSWTQALNEQGVLSSNGSSRTFDADADGYVRGEAVSTLFMKRLDDAVRDRNPVRAVIRSTGSNFDGKTPGISLPSAESQEALIRAVYEAAGIRNFGETAFVECHGTGTAAGDPIEVGAVANVFGEKGVYIGSVKPNIGHSEAAAGLSSVIKMVLALENKTIPPNIKFEKPNPKSRCALPLHSYSKTNPVKQYPSSGVASESQLMRARGRLTAVSEPVLIALVSVVLMLVCNSFRQY
jgi:acyl transferase domain-containing protein